MSETMESSPESETNKTTVDIRKSSPFLNPTADASNEMLQLLLSELKEMRMEMKEIKEDVSMMKMEQENQKESLKEITRNQQNQQQILQELKENISLTRKTSKTEPELYGETDIRRRINGKWRDVKKKNDDICTKFENDILMIKCTHDDYFTRYKLGHHGDKAMFVENNKIVQRYFTDKGQVELRREYYIENQQLIYVTCLFGGLIAKHTYERVGDSDTE